MSKTTHHAGTIRGLIAVAQRGIVWALVFGVRLYQVTLGPVMGGHCRFQPTCSVYAIDALRAHGPWRGSWLTIRRLLRCHPLGGCGYDPVPPTEHNSTAGIES